jgi:hypothetical protein
LERNGSLKWCCGADTAVSETISALIMVTFAVTVFSVISLAIVNPWMTSSEENDRVVTLVGAVELHDAPINDQVVLEHRGGEPLPANMDIFVTVDDPQSTPQEFHNDHPLSIGEQFSINIPNELDHTYVKIVIVDQTTSKVIMDKVLQDPLYIITYPAELVSEDGANFRLSYGFKNINPIDQTRHARVYFEYVKGTDFSSGTITEVPVTPPLASFADVSQFVPLESGVLYTYRAFLSYYDDVGSLVQLEAEKYISFWTYQQERGIYRFETDIVPHITDESLPSNNGSIPAGDVNHIFPGYKLDSTALNFTGNPPKGYVTVPPHDKLNITDKLTIDAWIRTRGKDRYIGNLSEKKNTSWNALLGVTCLEPNIIQVAASNGIYAVVYRNTSERGAYICTVKITDDGTVSVVSPSRLLYPESIKVVNPKIFQVTDDVYGIIFGAPSDANPPLWRMKLVEINNDGNVINELNKFDGSFSLGNNSDIVPLSVTSDNAYFAIAFGGGKPEDNPGYIQTISIDFKNHFSVTEVSLWKFQDRINNAYKICREATIVPIGNSCYAVAFTEMNSFGQNLGGHILLVRIGDNGDIDKNAPAIANLTTNSVLLEPCFINVRQDVYALLFVKKDSIGQSILTLQTFWLTPKGEIFVNTNGHFEFAVYTIKTDIVHVENEIYAVAYVSIGSLKGSILTLQIDESGLISVYPLDTLEFRKQGVLPTIISASSGNPQYVAVYGGVSQKFPPISGFLGVVDIDTSARISSIFEKAGVFSLKTDGRRLIGNMTVESSGSESTCSVTGFIDPDIWIHVVLAYNSEDTTPQLKLSVTPLDSGTTTVYSSHCEGSIVKKSSPLIFGPFYGYLDDVVIQHV